MRPLEIALALALASRMLLVAVPGSAGRAWRGVAALATGALLVAALFLEPLRWQLVPLAALATLVLLTQLLTDLRPVRDAPRRRAAARAVLGLAVVALAAAPVLVLPVVAPPAPTGPYAVGSLAYALEDDGRAEIYGAGVGEARRLVARVWYPADDGALGVRAPFLRDPAATARAMADYAGLPPFAFSHLALTRAGAWWLAPVSDDRVAYPVVLFQHGWAGYAEQSTFLVEDLASHGYVVVSLEHPYAALLSVFPDGTRLPLFPDALPDGVSDEVYDAAARRLGRQWRADAAFALARLEAEPPATLAGRLDLDRLGLVGHSTGGGAGVEFCAQEARCRLAVALDPWLGPVPEEVLDGGTDAPALFVFSDPTLRYFAPVNRQRFERFAAASEGEVRAVSVDGMGHMGFADAAGFSPILPRLAPLLGWNARFGALPARRGFEIVRSLVLASLDGALGDGEPDGAPAAPRALPFPEVRRLDLDSTLP